MKFSVSIIICTRNRAGSLQDTLASIGACKIPTSGPTEVLVVDNGSTDHTQDVVGSAQIGGALLRYVLEPEAGQCHARNRGLRESTGGVILFTDDDVRLPSDWIARMSEPIIRGDADAVAGGVRLAQHLQNSWMTPLHRSWLASTEYLVREQPQEMVGANMAFSRRILERVPAFDIELGPGALGQGDDALFSCQLRKAGFRIADRLNVEVEHHPDRARVTRDWFLLSAQRRGRTMAYHRYHWEHHDEPEAEKLAYDAAESLRAARRRSWRHWLGVVVAPEWELLMELRASYYAHWLVERMRPRNYERLGLVKRAGNRGACPSGHSALEHTAVAITGD